MKAGFPLLLRKTNVDYPQWGVNIIVLRYNEE